MHGPKKAFFSIVTLGRSDFRRGHGRTECARHCSTAEWGCAEALCNTNKKKKKKNTKSPITNPLLGTYSACKHQPLKLKLKFRTFCEDFFGTFQEQDKKSLFFPINLFGLLAVPYLKSRPTSKNSCHARDSCLWHFHWTLSSLFLKPKYHNNVGLPDLAALWLFQRGKVNGKSVTENNDQATPKRSSRVGIRLIAECASHVEGIVPLSLGSDVEGLKLGASREHKPGVPGFCIFAWVLNFRLEVRSYNGIVRGGEDGG